MGNDSILAAQAATIEQARELLKRWRDDASVWTFGADYKYTCCFCRSTPHCGHRSDCIHTQTAEFLEQCDG